MKELVEIQLSSNDVIRINFIMTTSCTYACRYCPDRLHLGKHKSLDLNELRDFFNKFHDRKIYLTLSGGECTTHPQFKDIAKLAKDMGIKVAADSNSVRTARFYDSVKDLIDVWCITMHPSQHVLDVEKIKVLTDNGFVVVFVLMDPDYWDTAVKWLTELESVKNIKLVALKALSNWGGTACTVTYTPEQENFLLNYQSKYTFTKSRETELRQTHNWMLDTESYGFYNDGSKIKIDPYQILKEQTNNFFGWDCNAGNDSILINDDGSANWANCGIKKFDHFNMIDPIELKKPIRCTLAKCECGTDIRSNKKSPSSY
jgi:organic radical activating enzyme